MKKETIEQIEFREICKQKRDRMLSYGIDKFLALNNLTPYIVTIKMNEAEAYQHAEKQARRLSLKRLNRLQQILLMAIPKSKTPDYYWNSLCIYTTAIWLKKIILEEEGSTGRW